MVFIISDDLGAVGWKGLLFDCYLPERELLEELTGKFFTSATGFEKHFNPKEMHSDRLLSEIMEGVRRPFCKSKYPLILDHTGQSRRCSCDLYILSNESKKILEPPFNPIYEEFDFDERREDYRIIMFIDEDCPDPEGYMSKVVIEADLTLKMPHQYKDMDSFEKACNELIERSLDYFSAPCMKCAHNLENIGLDVSY